MSEPPFLNLAQVYERAQRSAELSKADFLNQFVGQCYRGGLRVTGFPYAVAWSFDHHDLVLFQLAGRGREEIPAATWTDLNASFAWGGCASYGNADVLTTLEPSRDGEFETTLWGDLSFDRSEVEKLWPEPKVQASANGKRLCTEWLKQLRQEHPISPKSKDEFLSEARENFGVGPRQFQDAWSAAAAAVPNSGWGRAGPRGKS